MRHAQTLSYRDRMGVLACLVLGTPADEAIAAQADDALYAEIAGAVAALPTLPLPERIQHAFAAQRIDLDIASATEIAKTLFFDGLDPVWDAQSIAA